MSKTIKIIQKALIGSGSTFLFIYIRNLPNPRTTNFIIVIMVFLPLMTVLNLYHSMSILKSCYKCDTPYDWGNCSGFKSITRNMEKYGLDNILLNLEELSQKILKRRKLKNKT